MRIFSNEEIRRIERQTIEQEGVTSLELIEIDAEAIAGEITARWRPNKRLLVFAGWGNNGAEALETSRQLAEHGYRPEIYLVNVGDRLSPECRVCRDRIKQDEELPISLTEITGKERFQFPDPDSDSLIIDGLFGSGLDRALPVSIQQMVHNINQSGATVVSIDVPSGLFCDWNSHVSRENMVHADLTLALGAPRLSFMIEDNAKVVGEWKVLDVGLSRKAIRESPYTFYIMERNTLRQFLPARDLFASKADFGSALIFAGSQGLMGAAILAARGALRSGAGKVTIHSAGCGMPIVQIAEPCAMFRSDVNGQYITQIENVESYTSVAIGPGIGTSDKTIAALETFLKIRNSKGEPVILDADALNCIAKKPLLLNYVPVLSVITPHAGEFDRIFGEQPSHEARLRKAIEVAKYHEIIIVLKGRFTAIVRPDGKVFFNSSGCPAMATPGSGDVLTGMIAGLMAQGIKPEKATFIACYVHGVAGELAAIEHGDYGVTATDIANNIGRAIVKITE
jgi:NAD(P)H-hydrate epimerase